MLDSGFRIPLHGAKCCYWGCLPYVELGSPPYVELRSLAKQRGIKTLGLLFKLYSIVDHIFRLQLVSQLLGFY